jgi:hypothetical protein
MPLSPGVVEARINVRICQLRIIAAMTALRPDRHVCYVLDDGDPVAWPYGAPIALDRCRPSHRPGKRTGGHR